jgi:hypothetical protein
MRPAQTWAESCDWSTGVGGMAYRAFGTGGMAEFVRAPTWGARTRWTLCLVPLDPRGGPESNVHPPQAFVVCRSCGRLATSLVRASGCPVGLGREG